MQIPESQVHSFIVKLWLEKVGDEKGMTVWHGHITHVPSGERRYLKDLRDILGFVKLYIEETGADITQDSKTRSWLKLWPRRKR
jgi:hypothetical protein